ncbi:MAG: byfunctional acetaldehyde dehydrogenase/ alcohol dehydrogenase AdhE [Candidatus Paraimprobicoccus trichonymphae]|uniref:Byfunctional acetaldehyde dehydrogenase/ alcohol dehydrogenase AdhE n=1 Tax=Candidatus Paraimprobicoccus trichonymphae TaxID=3033793 RepID=A0AA48I4A0_9FIRM|nr:MAG: byfunctional acetaldehyde dehydrogenase/ alcohol dehydrogenase AdhE [Candidatus Paraimprobicoccus trichonymphae]
MSSDIKNIIDNLVFKAKESLDRFSDFNQEKIDIIVEKMYLSGSKKSKILAKLAYEETKRGVIKDKIEKNIFSTKNVFEYIKNKRTVGIINYDKELGCVEIADSIGVIAGVTPVTNPTSTVMFKSLICFKTRNPIIFGFHPGAQKCSVEAAKILKQAALENGAPENCIQWIETPSIEATNYLINNFGVDLVLATGGSAMVKAAYSTGKPALGVGPGNVPCYIEKTADLKKACENIIISKTFDNGMICASEQSVIVDKEIFLEFEKIMKKENCYFLNNQEVEKLSKFIVIRENHILNTDIVGKSAYWIAKQVDIDLPENTKILIAKLKNNNIGRNFPLSWEKLSPILAYYVSENNDLAIEISEKILNLGGLGHTSVIHSKDLNLISKFGLKIKTGRVLVNSPASQGAIGGIYNKNIPTLTIGCGSYGKNSTTDNISIKNLINIKRIFDFHKTN